MKTVEIVCSGSANQGQRDALLRYAYQPDPIKPDGTIVIMVSDESVEEIKNLDFVDKLTVDGSVVKEPQSAPDVQSAPQPSGLASSSDKASYSDMSKPDPDVDVSKLNTETADTVMDEQTHTKPK
jgi:hypothetical protein